MSSYTPLGASSIHHEFCADFAAMLVSRGQRRSYIAPRGNAKSTWASKVLPVASAIYGTESYIILAADSITQSKKNLEAVKDTLENNEKIRQDFPWAAGKGSKWDSEEIITRTGIRIEAVGTGSKVRGRTNLTSRPTLIIGDDLQNDESVESATQRDKDYEWLNRVLVPAGDKNTNIIVLGTALHRDDIQQRLKKTPGWRSRTYSSVIKWPRALNTLWAEWAVIFGDPFVPEEERETKAKEFYENNEEAMIDGSQVIWPEKESLYDLMSLRETLGRPGFEAEKQGSPTSTKYNEWPEHFFSQEIWFKKWPQTKLRVVAVDMSKGKTDRSDYSSFVDLGVGHDGLLYVDADIARMDPATLASRALDHYEVFVPDAIGFEINGFQELVQTQFKAEAIKRGLPVVTCGINNTLDKKVRIRKLSPFLRNGRFRFKAGSRGAELLVDQLRDFPTGQHDDGPDALEMAIRLVQYVLNPNPQPDDADMPVTQLELR